MKLSHTFLTRVQVSSLLQLYDVPHPCNPQKILRGYDKAHAHRTTRLCLPVAIALGHTLPRLQQFEAACLLHDMGRAGLDPKIFGKIWSWAKQENIPTRPREWRAAHPETVYGKESQDFIKRYHHELHKQGLALTASVKDHIDMRLGFARRLKKQLRPVKTQLKALGVPWAPWMEQIMLYYYYPEKLDTAPAWTHQLGEILVACEQLEAYSNHQRGKDYYARSEESFQAAFRYLRILTRQHIVSREVFRTICRLTREGCFTTILRQARGGTLSTTEQQFLSSVKV